MIVKTFEVKGEGDSNIKLFDIKIQMNNEDYDRILSAVDRSECNQMTKIGVKLGKFAIKIPQVRAFLPELFVDYKLKKLLNNVNEKLEEYSVKYGVEHIKIEENEKGE